MERAREMIQSTQFYAQRKENHIYLWRDRRTQRTQDASFYIDAWEGPCLKDDESRLVKVIIEEVI